VFDGGLQATIEGHSLLAAGGNDFDLANHDIRAPGLAFQLGLEHELELPIRLASMVN
jgi:hypothetical protein